MVSPMIPPPATEAPSPSEETPPFVPGGTVLPERMKNGGEAERMPSSEARVSARQVAKWLENASAVFQMRRKKLTPKWHIAEDGLIHVSLM
jgi:hypothetical protein